MATGARSTWKIDVTHSSITFGIRHLVIAKVRGSFDEFSGVLEVDDADLTQSSVAIEIDAASIDTRSDPRDGHLRSPDFLDVARFPTATFVSEAIEQRGDEYDVLGALTLRGVTRELTLKATFGGKAKDSRGRERIAFAAKASIERETFGLTWNQALELGGFALGPLVDLEIDIQAMKP